MPVIEYIDIGPKTWAEHLPLLLALVENGNSEGRKYAAGALERMAKVADRAVELTKNPPLAVATQVDGRARHFWFNGVHYMIGPNLPGGPNQDAWRYWLPDGQDYTHPTEFGALLMCLKHAAGGEWSPVPEGE